jgi:5-methylcytosine-specific restriction endonuclease McrA
MKLSDYEIAKNKAAEERRKKEARISKKTDEYINKYLLPNTRTDNFKCTYKVMYSQGNFNLDHDRIANIINEMEYSDFLTTLYWQEISYRIKKFSNFKCNNCGSSHNLQVHHKYYTKHGYEHQFHIAKDMLVCLCNECHAKIHK